MHVAKPNRAGAGLKIEKQCDETSVWIDIAQLNRNYDGNIVAPDGGGGRMYRMEPKDIGYYGKPIDALSRDELINAITELAQAIYDCAATNGDCRKFVPNVDATTALMDP
jgi:hypothetical protein